MSELIFVFFTILVITSLIYFMYRIILTSDKEKNNAELQISSGDILEQITILYKQKKYKIVENLAGRYLEKKPKEVGVRTIYTKTLYEENKVYEAIDQAKIIIKLQPKNIDMKLFLANCYLRILKSTKAINLLQEILVDDPNNAIALKDLAQAYFDTNQKKSAVKMYERLDEFLENNQEKVDNKQIVADIHVYFKEYKEAIKAYREILEIYPENLDAKKRLMELYKSAGNYSEAIDLGYQILNVYSSDNNSLWAMKMLMEVYLEMKDYEKALEYANLVKEHPLSGEIESGENIAKIMQAQGQFDGSIDILKSLSIKDSQNVQLKKSLAKSYALKNDFESASETYKEILDAADIKEIDQIHLEISDLYLNWAMYLFSQGDNDSCFKKFAIAVQYYKYNPDIYCRMGDVNRLIKNYNEAIIQYKKALEHDPHNAAYYYALAECYEEIDSVYEQKKALLEYLKYDLSNAIVHYKLGLIYDAQNDSSTAISYIKKAIDADDNFVDPKHKLALMLELKGDKEGAIRIYEQILKIEPFNEVAINNLNMLKSQQ